MSSATRMPASAATRPPAAPTEDAIQSWLIATLAERLSLDPAELDLQEPFDNYGLGSTDAVIISGDLEEWLNRELSATLLWDYPTIRALAQFLAQPPAA